MKYFFDSHLHAMNLSHPDFISLITAMQSSVPDLLTSGFFSPSFLFNGKFSSSTTLNKKIANLLSTFEKPIEEIFTIMEEDLKFKFLPSAETLDQRPPLAYIRDKKFHFRNKEYDKLALCPLVMDFSNDTKEYGNLYYPPTREKKIISYAEDTLEGMKNYYKSNKDGIIEFFPFLGITSKCHSLEFIQDLLNTYINPKHIKNTNTKSKKQFFGVKFYPPIGLEPWPEDAKEKEKQLYIYQFCIDNDLPIITHCDDQGFRTLSSKEAWNYTNPVSWEPVLKEFPKLKLDFAHCGQQYSSISNFPTTAKFAQNLLKPKVERIPSSPWFYGIIDLMEKYENVYMDVSFSGSTPMFYVKLLNFLNSDEYKNNREHYINRILFGSDFNVNLFKLESYTQYFNIFETSKLSDKEIQLMASDNPKKFLGI